MNEEKDLEQEFYQNLEQFRVQKEKLKQDFENLKYSQQRNVADGVYIKDLEEEFRIIRNELGWSSSNCW